MYQLLYAPMELDEESFYDWAVWQEFPSIAEACECLAEEVKKDMTNGEIIAYRIVEKGAW